MAYTGMGKINLKNSQNNNKPNFESKFWWRTVDKKVFLSWSDQLHCFHFSLTDWLTDWLTDSLTVSFYGQNLAVLALCNQNPTFIEKITLFSTSGIASKLIFNPLRLLPKPILKPMRVLPKILLELLKTTIGVKLEKCELFVANIQPLLNQLHSYSSGMSFKAIFIPLRVLPKPILKRMRVASKVYYELCKNNDRGKIEFLSDQFTIYNPYYDFQIWSSAHESIFKAYLQPHESTSKSLHKGSWNIDKT